MAESEDLMGSATLGAHLRAGTKATRCEANNRGTNMKDPTRPLGSGQRLVVLVFIFVGWAQISCLHAQEVPFSSSQAYRDLLTSLGETVVHPSRMSAGELLKGPLPTVSVEQVETKEGLTIESTLWRVEISRNPWGLCLINKATQGAWKLRPDASGTSGIWWGDSRTGIQRPLQLSRAEKVQRSGNRWTMECRVEGTDKLATLVLDIIAPSVIRLSIGSPSLGQEAKLGINVAGPGPYFGLGERFSKAKLDGLKINLHPEDNWDVSINPGHNWTYAPVPFLLSPNGLGLYLDTARISTFDLTKGESQGFSAQLNGPSTDCYFFVADGPKGVISAYTSLTGRTPLSPPWVFGVWVCALKGRGAALSVARRLRQEGIPTSAIWSYDLPDIAGNMVAPHGEWGYYGAPRQFTDALHQLGFKVLWYVKPFVFPYLTPYFSPNPDYEQGLKNRLFVLTSKGEPVGPSYPLIEGEKLVMTGDLDFTSPPAVDWWQKKIQVALADYDFDGWMEDYGEYVDEDNQFAYSKNAGRDMANLYTLFYHKITYLMANKLKPDAVAFSRSGYAGSQGYSPVLWGGDQAGDWTTERGLASLVPAGISAGLSGFAVFGPDIACATSSKELYTRWTEFGALTPVMRTHAWGMPNFTVDIWFDSQTIDIFRRYAKLHTSLFPYFYTFATAATKDGLPIMRHPMLEWPDDPQTYDAENEYLLGDKVLVAPVIKEGARTRNLYLPKGSWVDYWTGSMLQGGRQVEVQAPLERIPIFVKAGSVLPMVSPETETLAQDLAGNKYRTIGKSLIWRIFPATGPDRGDFTLYDGTAVTVDRQPGRTQVKGTHSPVVRAYEVILPGEMAPNEAELSGRRLIKLDDAGYRAGKEGWWLSTEDGLLHVLFTSDNFELALGNQ